MLDSKQREAQLLKARERLARAFARLETIIGSLPERMRTLESSRNAAQKRVQEIEELLERERAITGQRQALSESAAEEVQALEARLDKSEQAIADRDKKIAEMERDLDRYANELLAYEKNHVESLEREEKLNRDIAQLREDNQLFERQIELLKGEREQLLGQLQSANAKDSAYALLFTQDERLGLLKTIDTLIERVDKVAGHHFTETGG